MNNKKFQIERHKKILEYMKLFQENLILQSISKSRKRKRKKKINYKCLIL